MGYTRSSKYKTRQENEEDERRDEDEGQRKWTKKRDKEKGRRGGIKWRDREEDEEKGHGGGNMGK